jgi:predicted XRE-type DNA-binding protein|nr:MAG TPA: Regulatory protein-modification, helix-turn-helix, transcriptional regulato, DNA [Caudoviricetes sp.]
MNGEELKQYIKRSGMSVAAVAEELGTSPQNLNAKFNRKSIKIDFFQKIKEIIDKCAPPLPAEMEEAVFGSNVNGSNSSNVSQSIGSDAALAAENKLLREQNEFLQSQVKTLLAIVGQR